jgi:ABC-type glycerol-3-phosphate transport system substrate-binding protein
MSASKFTRREFLTKIAAGAATVPLLQACAPAAAPPEEKEEGEPEPTEAPAGAEKVTVRWYQAIGVIDVQAEMFNEMQDRIEVVFEQSTWGEHAQKIVMDAAAGTAADIWFVGAPFWIGVKQQDVCLPIKDHLNSGDVDLSGFEFDPQSDWCSLNGQSHGLPTNGVIMRGISYNEALYEAGGVDIPNDQWRWDDLIAAGTALHDPPNVYGADLANLVSDVWLSMIWSNGGQIVNEDETKCMLDQPEVIEVVQGVLDWSHEYQFTMAPGEAGALGDFPTASGKIANWHAIFTDWDTWMTQTKELEVPAWQTTFPLPNNAPQRKWAGSVHVEAIWKETQVPDEAWEFNIWRTTAKESLEYQITLFQVNYNLKETVDAVIEDPKRREFMGLALDEYKNAEGEYWGGGTSTSEVLDTFKAEFDLAYLQEKTAEQAMKDATATIDRILAS